MLQRLLSISLILLGLNVGVWAQAGGGVTVSVVPERTQVTPGGRVAIAVVLDHAEGYHTWPSADQDVLPPDIAEFAIRTSIAATVDPPGAARVGKVQWPEPHPGLVPNISGGPPIEVPLYHGRSVAYVPLILSDAVSGVVTVKVTTNLQACDESTCLPPQETTQSIELTIADEPGPEVGGSLFFDFDATNYEAMQGAPGEPAEQGSEAPAASAKGGKFLGVFDVPGAGGSLGLVATAVLAMVGGFVLNLTPCVLPVIPIKMMAISHHAGSPGRSLVLGIWMALGVVAFWLALSLPVILLSGFTDPSVIFGFWWVTLGIGLIIAIMGLGIMGLFEIQLPRSVYAINPKADSAWGSFLFGVMTGVLGLPCFGFVAGGLLAGAATLPAMTIVIIFLGLGVGMAAPYLVLSAKPQWAARVPRTGPASVLVKQVMGFLLLAAASFFVAVGLRTLILDYPWLTHTLRWWVVAFFVAIGSGWMVLRTFQITRSGRARGAMGVMAVMLAGVFVWFASDTTSKERQNYLVREAAMKEVESHAVVTGAWVEYSQERLDRALKAGKIVVIDFTADWCINCKFLKATVLDRDPLHSRLVRDDVVMLEADLTSSRAEGNAKMKELGQTGIPLLVVYSPTQAEPFWLGNAYTGQQVVEVIDRAAEAVRAAGLSGGALAGGG